MQDIAEIFDEKFPDSWIKERMAYRLAEIYERNPRTLLRAFSYPVVTFLRALFERKLNGLWDASIDSDPVFGDLTQFYDQLEFLSLIDYTEGKLIVPEFLSGVVSGSALAAPEELEAWQEMELCALGMLDVYGLIEERLFLQIFCSCFPGINEEQAVDFLTRRLEVRIMSYRVDFGNGVWWLSDLIDNPEEWYLMMHGRSRIEYRRYTKDEYIDFALYAFSQPPKNYERLIAILRQTGVSPDEAEAILEDEIMTQRCQLEPRLGVPEFIKDTSAVKSITDVQRMLDVYREFCNDIPLWLNKGHTPSELFHLSSGAARSGSTSPNGKRPGIQKQSNIIPFPAGRAHSGKPKADQ